MSSKKRQDQYTAGLVSKPFWFYEYKAYVNELLNGSSADEIRSSAFEKHLFSAAKEYRVKEILNCVSRRVTQFDQDWQELFGQQSVMVQRMMVLLSIMADDKLFFTFMYRVYRDKLIVGAESLESSDVLAFFRLMQNGKLLNDAGLLAGDKMVPPLPSSALKQYLKAHDMNAYLMAITGADE